MSIGYDDQRRILKVRFRNGRTYAYLSVPRDVYRRFLSAPSVGKYLNEVIKPNYRAIRVRRPTSRRPA